MLSDLEPVVDQSYIRDETGAIVGRQPGLRGWIGFYTPSLVPHYKSLMAYKALADKLRLALHINEPDTLDNILELGPQPESKQSKNSKNTEENAEAARKTQGTEQGVSKVGGEISEGDPQEAGQVVEKKPKEAMDKVMEGAKNSAEEASGEDTKGKGVFSNSMQLKERINVMKSNVESIKKSYHDLFDAGLPGTMAALEATVRERLGLAWMRRGGRKTEPAA